MNSISNLKVEEVIKKILKVNPKIRDLVLKKIQKEKFYKAILKKTGGLKW